jgi:hypothetical protein
MSVVAVRVPAVAVTEPPTTAQSVMANSAVNPPLTSVVAVPSMALPSVTVTSDAAGKFDPLTDTLRPSPTAWASSAGGEMQPTATPNGLDPIGMAAVTVLVRVSSRRSPLRWVTW